MACRSFCPVLSVARLLISIVFSDRTEPGQAERHDDKDSAGRLYGRRWSDLARHVRPHEAAVRQPVHVDKMTVARYVPAYAHGKVADDVD